MKNLIVELNKVNEAATTMSKLAFNWTKLAIQELGGIENAAKWRLENKKEFLPAVFRATGDSLSAIKRAEKYGIDWKKFNALGTLKVKLQRIAKTEKATKKEKATNKKDKTATIVKLFAGLSVQERKEVLKKLQTMV